MSSARFYSAYVFFALALVALSERGVWAWMPVVAVFGLIPVADALMGKSSSEGTGTKRRGFDLAVELWAPAQLALLVFAMADVQRRPPTSALEWAGLCSAMAIVSGAGGITVAHELMHRSGARPRALAEVLMTLVLYAHFSVEHVLGHHRIVGTREDPATARRGETVFAFVPRSVFGGLVSAWRLESRRVARLAERASTKQRGVLVRWLADRRFRYGLTQTSLLIFVGLAFGPRGLGLFVGQALGAVLLLELINFVEHYGLTRALVNGRPERTREQHSWNSRHRLTSAMLFHLTRHSDHHHEASRPYHLLRARPCAPELPAGYPTMVLLSLVPPLWRKVMDPRAEAARKAAPTGR